MTREPADLYAILLSANYDREIDPGGYERYVLSFTRRDLLADEIGALFQQHLPPSDSRGAPTSVIEFAAGTGIVSRNLAGRGYKVTATDISYRFLAHLRRHLPGAIPVVANFNVVFPFKDESFDGATILWANRYINDSNRFLLEVYRVLTPGGVFVWPVFSVEWPLWKKNAGFRQPTLTASLAHQAAEHGFRSVYTVPFILSRNLSRMNVVLIPNYIIAKK